MTAPVPVRPDRNERDRGRMYDEYFESRKPIELGHKLWRRFHRKMLAAASRIIPDFSKRTILELGPGLGIFAEEVRGKTAGYSAIEMNAGNAERLRAAGFDVVNATVPPFPDGPPAGVVWMSHVLEHARDFVEARTMVSEAARRLAPGGWLVVIAPDVLSWKEHFFEVDWTHGYPTSLGRVEQLLRDAGFEVAFARHHTAGFLNPVAMFFATNLLRALPFDALDALTRPFTGRRLFFSFMSMMGWRQIFVAGRKR